jgi:hypothetical protein
MDFASRVDGGTTADGQGVTASQPSLSLDGWKTVTPLKPVCTLYIHIA